MSIKLTRVLLAAVLGTMIAPVNVSATNGMFLIGFGSKSRAMGGVGVSNNMDGLAAAFNPATLVDSSNEFTLAAELFRPPRAIYHESTTLGYTNERSRQDLFMIPAMGGAWKWRDKITLGFAFIGAGLKTEYAQSVSSGSCQDVLAGNVPGYTACPPTVFNVLNNNASPEAGVELFQLQLLPSIAYQINDSHSVGFTLVVAQQFFRAEGLQDFDTLGFTSGGVGAGGLTDEGFSHSFGLGVRLGWYGKYMDGKLTLGVNYSPRVDMNRFERYTNLFAENGDFDIPERYSLGLTYRINQDALMSFEIQQTNYDTVASISNPGPDASNPSSFFSLCQGLPNNDPCKLGGPLGLGFGWENQTVYKLGGQWRYSEKIALRGGLNYGKAPIPEDQVLFNMLAPATPEWHLTLGAEYIFSSDYILSVNYMHAFLNTIRGPTAFGQGGAVVTGSNASIAMKQDSLGATLSIKF